MNKPELENLAVERLLAARTFPGRLRLSFGVCSKRLSWRFSLGFASALKRVFDLFASATLILLMLPLLVLLALLIKLEDGGPIFFVQTRVGKFGREFKMFKFRSMCRNAEARKQELLDQNQHAHGVTFKIKNDPRITNVGRWLRKLSFDELPQLFNVALGDMSLVGPRPPVPSEVALYSLGDRRRLNITPGITCFWQVGGRSDIDFPKQVELDVLYIERQNFWTDLVILLKTVPAVLNSKGAY